MGKLALVLFDADGLTSVVQTSKLKGYTHLQEGEKCLFPHFSIEYKCEILKLSDSKADLNKYETQWQDSPRALEIEKVIETEKVHGYLEVKAVINDKSAVSSAVEERELLKSQVKQKREVNKRPLSNNTHVAKKGPVDGGRRKILKTSRTAMPIQTEKQDKESSVQKTSIIKGSNGRFVRVLHQGSNETTPENVIALPQREPFYTRDLTTDQAEVLRGLVNDNQNNKRSFGTQTEPVVIFQDRDELLASYDPKGRTLEDLAKLLADISSAVNDLKEPVSLIPGIKETIHSVQEDVTLSKILQEGLSNSFSTPAKLEKIGSTVKSTNEGENSPSVEQCVVTDSIEETISANVQNIIIEPGIKEEVIDPAESNCPVVVSEDAFVLGNIQVPITNQILTLENEFNASPDNNIHEKGNTSMDVYTAEILKPHPLLQSYSGPFAEISSHNDMSTIPHECEVRVSKHLQHQLRPQLSYPGGYGWQIVQRLFRPQELVGRNYYGNYGKMPLSPRRRHAVEHVLTEVYNNDVIFIKQAISGINTGIRNCMRTRVNRKPLFPIKTINNSLC